MGRLLLLNFSMDIEKIFFQQLKKNQKNFERNAKENQTPNLRTAH